MAVYDIESKICSVCPRRCGKPRGTGFCGMGEKPVIARVAPHFWEEPCISGTRGSGAVFFSVSRAASSLTFFSFPPHAAHSFVSLAP